MENVKVEGKLLTFLEEWYAWATTKDTKNSGSFSTTSGLCRCLSRWGLGCYPLHVKLKAAFKASGLNVVYPFGESSFDRDLDNGTMHKSRKRLAWVKTVILNSGGKLK